MNCPPEKRLTRRDAERLLRARATGRGTHRSSFQRLRQPEQFGRLVHLLDAAAEPSPGDPARQAQALAAFQQLQQSQSAPIARPKKVTAMKAAVIAALSTKLAAGVAVAAAATGGIALAASTGALSGSGDTHPTNSPPAARSVSHSRSQSASPAPDIKGLCTAYRAGATSNKGNAARNPAFTALAKAAGGTGNISAYCASTLASAHPSPTAHPGAQPTDLPAHPGGKPTAIPPRPNPTGGPSAVPSHSRPVGKPTAIPSHSHPGGKPTTIPSHSHPGGKPTTIPSHSHPGGKPTGIPSHSH